MDSEAIRYIEHTANTVVEDLNYNLRQQEEEDHSLQTSIKRIREKQNNIC
jgi:hypothetical protein